MRVPVLALLLAVPLLAEDPPPFAESIGMWRSEIPSERDSGSQMAEIELRRMLAPLLKVMDDDDPEVRRRARHAILSLVPGEIERLRAAVLPVGRNAAVANQQFQVAMQLNAGQQARVRALLIRGLQQQVRAQKLVHRLAQTPDARAAGILDDSMGITARTTRQTKPFAIGVRVMRVRKAKAGEGLGLRRGDVIVKLGEKRVGTPEELVAALGSKPDWKSVKLTVVRIKDGTPKTIALP